ncbi:error-prone DNA polymerase [Methylorubrum populi]|jgi:error-prone DNA polymerase|uniref:Error-prone DNA polymerase n=2 Tax=Methylobacteriaceae TaxID=119045 RepID=A0ABU9ZIQ7_9HYPH|nr:error-prone DNA polymerase [Methylorubrum rhodesianum]MBI1688292.1 DNA polymerase III subunit alpha [Methylorubrum sp. DB1722]MBK3405440.1 error-prone DNA polymerase [Methylorubrum rhodesianum]MBY0139372.1 error-prone DNA polymerase [Methylorubrum populi]
MHINMTIPELQVTTHFSFLRGASSPEELFSAAALLGIPSLGVTDHGSLAGMVRAHQASKVTGVRLVVGCRLDLDDSLPVLVYPTDRAAYGRLCRLLSLGKARGGKGRCRLTWADLEQWQEGLLAILLAEHPEPGLSAALVQLKKTFGARASCALTRRFRPDDADRLDTVAAAARAARVPTVATGDILYHVAGRRRLQDVVTCIRLGLTIDRAGFAKERHADRFLKPPEETARLFARFPEALARAGEISAACTFSLDHLAYTYPTEVREDGLSPQERLETLAWAGAETRYPHGVPEAVARQLRHELDLIGRLAYAPYFLTVESIVRFANEQKILCQGRGSAANSAVCFCLRITSIDPMQQNLLFERFVSEARREPPDIDVDFEHERREEVIQWIFQTYGRHRSALTAIVSRFRSRGALREVGKVMGLPEDVTGALNRMTWSWSSEGVGERELRELNLNPDDRRLRLTLEIARELIGTPRHLSQHPGGFVLTLDRLDELVPVEPAAMADRQVIEWDKDDIDALKFMKVDVLGLGMLGCLRRAFDLLAEVKNDPYDLASIPPEDDATYAMIRRADTLGVFQIESRAQMAMLPRMKPKTFYDLVIEVAIVRPGPIQGDMVHPYIRRREKREEVTYPTPELKAVLEKTLGVPLFQEQAMQVAMVAAGFSATEADELRRSMATFKFTGGVHRFHDRLVEGMVANGYARDFAERTFKQLEGFGSYGFPESHAASFALLAYASSWMKCHHPDVFCAALLNAQPMGFYAPAQIVRDARAHGVVIRPLDVNYSEWDCTLESLGDGRKLFAVRLGLRLAGGLPERDGQRLVTARGRRPFAALSELSDRAGLPAASLTCLVRADAFRSLGLSRREAAWAAKALRPDPLPLFTALSETKGADPAQGAEPAVSLPAMSAGGEVVADYCAKGLSLRAHPLAFLRETLTGLGAQPCAALDRARDGAGIVVAGLVLMRQRPGSAKGTMFMTLEDETGIANLIVRPELFDRQRRVVLGARLMACRGRVQRSGAVVHLVAAELYDRSGLLRRIGEDEETIALRTGRGDETGQGVRPDPRASALPVRARNFR